MEKIVEKYGKEIEKCKSFKDLKKLFKKISKKEGFKILDLSAHQNFFLFTRSSSPLPRLPANEPESGDAGRHAKPGERLRVNICPICGSKLEEKTCWLYDAASAEIIDAKEYVCKKCGFTRVISPI